MKTLKNKMGVSVLLAGLLAVTGVNAGVVEQKAFKQTSLEKAVSVLSNGEKVIVSKNIVIMTPRIAERAENVGIGVTTSLKNVESISILVQGNRQPFVTRFRLSPQSVPEVRTRLKVYKEPNVPRTADVVALVKAGGKWYRATQKVKITEGGCGG